MTASVTTRLIVLVLEDEDMINETSAAHQLIVVVMAAKAGIQNVAELLRKRASGK
jgi:hypothetical protein